LRNLYCLKIIVGRQERIAFVRIYIGLKI